MSKVTCPYCFEIFKSSEVLFRCSNYSGSCPDVPDSKMNEFWGDRLMYKPVAYPKKSIGNTFGKMPKSAVCNTCKKETTKTICPHCHNELPREMAENGGFIISIIGARSSGKTNYITTLINELKHRGHLIDIGIYETGVGRKPEEYTIARYEKDFYDILYKKQRCHAQNAANDPRSKIPLIYKLFSTKKKEQAYLVFYDTAGENFTDTRAIAEKAKFLENSDGIIFLLDTFAIPQVHNKLRQKLKLGEIELNYDKILATLLSYFDGLVNKSKFYKKPIALTFSKIDALLNNEELFGDSSLPGIRINSNSQFLDGKGYCLSDMESINKGIKSGLKAWDEVRFYEKIDAPVHFQGNSKYFGISALGDMPENGSVQHIKPYRVMDPLIWILHRLKFPLPIKK